MKGIREKKKPKSAILNYKTARQQVLFSFSWRKDGKVHLQFNQSLSENKIGYY